VPLSVRYRPEHPPDEECSFGLDYSFIIPPGVGITSGALVILTNTADPTNDESWVIGPVEVRGRAVYAMLSGGVPGVDYQLRWTAYDTQGNAWPRTTLVLCAETS
jgi:hypothetical protein